MSSHVQPASLSGLRSEDPQPSAGFLFREGGKEDSAAAALHYHSQYREGREPQADESLFQSCKS